MYFHYTILAATPLAIMASAGVDFDLHDVPQRCEATCRPIADLSSSCRTDLNGDDDDDQETQLEVQCVCTNTSFDVASVAALCQDCIRQNHTPSGDDNDGDHDDNDMDGQGENQTDDPDDDVDDDNRKLKRRDDHHDDDDDAFDDINDIVRTCGFTSTSWAATLSAASTSVSVSVERPTDISQLTTTFVVAGATSSAGGPIQTNNGDDDDGNGDDDGDDNGSGALAVPGYIGAAVAAAGLMAFA